MQITYTNFRPLFYKGKSNTVNLKIKKEDYNAISEKVNEVYNSFIGLRWSAYESKGLSAERYRWDIFHQSKFDCHEIYEYLNDSHIDSALKHIVYK